MNPIEIKIPYKSTNSSFNIRNDFPSINSKWHFHREMELVWFHEGNGIQYVGNSVNTFRSGDIVLVGPNIPHFWRFDNQCKRVAKSSPFTTTIHFTPDVLGSKFLNLPENVRLKSAFDRLKGAVTIPGNIQKKVCELITGMVSAAGVERIYLLLQCILVIGNEEELMFLSSPKFHMDLFDYKEDSINRIYQFVAKNFDKCIRIDDVAAISNLSTSSFCRYFRSKSGRTFSNFLKQVRIGHAEKLLLETNLSIQQISKKCGYRNLTSFYNQFKDMRGVPPLEFQKSILE